MANDLISGMAAAVAADVAGSAGRMELCKAYATAPTTLGLDFATLRTSMFAGSTGYTATDPLVCGAISTSGNFAIATTKFTVAAATGNTVVAGTLGVTGAATLSSTLAVTGTSTLTGNVAVGTTISTSVALNVRTAFGTTAGSQFGVYSSPTFDSGATTAMRAYYGQVITEAVASYSVTASSVYYAGTPSLGAGSTLTSNYGLYVQNQGAANVTHGYGVYIESVSGAATTNIGLYNAGTTTLAGAVTCSATLDVAGVSTVATAGATSYAVQKIHLYNAGSTAYFPYLFLAKSKNNTLNTLTTTVTGDSVGGIMFQGVNAAGSPAFASGARIEVKQNGAAGATYIPADIEFQTSDGTNPLAARLTIGANGTSTFAGALVASSTLAVTGNFAVNTNKFAVTAATGNTGIGQAASATSRLAITGLPTSAAGLAAGDVWSNSGVLTIV